jgi:sphinganine-1-phosphate aldolase
MIEGVKGIPELGLIGDPTFVISFGSDDVDIFHVNDFMITKGWRFNALQLPPGMHFCVTMPQTFVPGVAEKFTKDLKEGVAYAKTKAGTTADTAAIYGVAGNLEGNQAVTDMVYGIFDHLYSV